MSELPESWTTARIGDLCELINGRAFKPTDWTATGLPIVRIQNLNNHDARYNHFDGDVRDRFLIKHGDLLFAWSGTPSTSFGAHVWNGGPAILNQHIFNVLYRGEAVDRDFFRLAINQKLDELINKAHGGVGLRHVTKGRFEETEIELPALAEQRRIVRKLDGLSGRTKAARDELSPIPLLIEHYKRAILAKAFSGELTADWRGDRDPPSLTTVGSLVEDIRYGTSKKCHLEPEGVAVLRIPNISAGRVDLTDLKYAELNTKEMAKLALREGDILIVRSNGSADLVGRPAQVTASEAGLAYAGYLIRLRPNSRVDPEFLTLMLESPQVRRVVETTARSTSGVHNINSEELSALQVPCPERDEQAEIAQQITTSIEWLDAVAREQGNTMRLLDHLDNGLLARAFQGELVPHDPNVEPADRLLKRIRKEQDSPERRRGRKAAV